MDTIMAKASSGFGDRLRRLRLAAGLTQPELAERAGLHLHGLTKLEYGDREPGWLTVLALAKALGVGVEAFVVEGEPETEEEPEKRRPGRPSSQPPAEEKPPTKKRKPRPEA